ncbi:MAG: hypothetical protein QM811_02005 [Pirellulales bacterium]
MRAAVRILVAVGVVLAIMLGYVVATWRGPHREVARLETAGIPWPFLEKLFVGKSAEVEYTREWNGDTRGTAVIRYQPGELMLAKFGRHLFERTADGRDTSQADPSAEWIVAGIFDIDDQGFSRRALEWPYGEHYYLVTNHGRVITYGLSGSKYFPHWGTVKTLGEGAFKQRVQRELDAVETSSRDVSQGD